MNVRLRSIRGLGLFSLTAALCAGPHPATTKASTVYASLPLSFEVNRGQADPAARFVWHGGGSSLLLTQSGAMLRVHNETLRMQLTGARRSSEITGMDELPGKVNYFVGNDPREWRTDIPTYAKVKYRDVYPGVDLVYYGKGGQLEYDFIVAPGADPDAIRLRFQGADSLRVDSSGDMRFRMQTAEIRLRKPVVYQNTAAGRRVIDARYSLTGRDQIAFHVARYDASQALVIDPVLDFASYLGGNGFESGAAVAVDAAGNVYLTGSAWAPGGFPVVNPLPGSADWKGGFVAKLSPGGSSLLYATYLGDRGGRSSTAGVAVDAAGNAYVTGSTSALDFPTTKNAMQVTSGGGSDIWGFGPNSDAFITKLSPTGSALVYSTYLGGPGNENGTAIAVDAAGNAFVTGRIDPNPNAPFTMDRVSAFVAKINPAGSARVYMNTLGEAVKDMANAIAVDAQGNSYVTGSTYSPDFPVRNAFQPRPALAVAYRSADGGKAWTPSDSGLPTGVTMFAIDPRPPSILYVASDRGVARSIDGGETWKLVNSGITNLHIISVIVDPGAPSAVYAIAGGGGLFDPPAALYRTTNSGTNWTTVQVPLLDSQQAFAGPVSLAIDPLNSAVMYLGTYQGLFKSIDAGGHWSAANLTGYVSRLTIDSRNPSTIYAVSAAVENYQYRVRLSKSVDAGDTWAALSLVPDYTYAFIIDPNDSAILYANTAGGIAKSVEGGATWKVVIASGTLLTAAGEGGSGAVIYAASPDGLLVSADAGQTWTSTGFGAGLGISALAVDPTQPGKLYAGAYGGASQVFAAKLNPAGGVIYATYLGGSGTNEGRAIAADAQGNAYITGTTTSRDFPGVAPGRVTRDDAGDVFVAKLSPDGTQLHYANTLGGEGIDIGQAIAVDAGGNVYIAGSTESADFPTQAAVQDSPGGPSLLRSSDGGVTWAGTKRSPGVEVQVLATDAASAVVYAGGSRGVFVSRDGGSSWTSTGLTGATSLLAIDPRTPSTLYAAGGYTANVSYHFFRGSGIYRSIDSGQTWQPINTGLPTADIRALVIDPATPTTLYCATSEEIFKTTDSGQHWAATGPGGGSILALMIDPANPARILAIRFTSSNTEVLAGDEGGTSWRTLLQQSNFWSDLDAGNVLAVDPRGSSTIHALIWGAALTTNDGGANWRPLLGSETCKLYTLVTAPDNPRALYLGGANYNGRSCLFQTADGGQSWVNRYDSGLGITAMASSRFQPGTLYSAVNPGADAFVAKLGPDGATLIYSTYLGGARVDSASALAIDGKGGVWVAGTTQSADFPVARPLQAGFGGDPENGNYPGSDAFVVRLDEKSGQ